MGSNDEVVAQVEKIYGLMFSGGVDSIVCLKLLKEQEITPVLFHVSHRSIWKYRNKVKKLVQLLSPESPLYIWKGEDYKACLDSRFFDWGYMVNLDPERNDEPIAFSDFVDRLVVGYWKGDNPSQDAGMEMCRGLEHLVFPLADMTREEINASWKTLPDEVRVNTLSTSRKPNGEWISVKPAH